MHFLLYEASLNVTTFRYYCLGFFLAWTPLYLPILIFRYRCCEGHFPGFGRYIFTQLQTCSALVLFADYSGGSCSSNIVIFNNFLVFKFPCLISNINFLFPGKYSLLFHVVLQYQLNAFKIPKMVKKVCPQPPVSFFFWNSPFPCPGVLDFLRNLFFFKKVWNMGEVWTQWCYRFKFLEEISLHWQIYISCIKS